MYLLSNWRTNSFDRNEFARSREIMVTFRQDRGSPPRPTIVPRAGTGARPGHHGGSFGRVSGPADVPPEILDRLRPICLGLPESYEEPAWVGTRWRIRKRTFAHVFTVDPADHRLIARPAATYGPSCLLTFRASMDELDSLIGGGYPFYKPPWAADVVGMALTGDTDWVEVAELLTDSYCRFAPKKLIAQVDRPSGADAGGR
jgi:YjbR protein